MKIRGAKKNCEWPLLAQLSQPAGGRPCCPTEHPNRLATRNSLSQSSWCSAVKIASLRPNHQYCLVLRTSGVENWGHEHRAFRLEVLECVLRSVLALLVFCSSSSLGSSCLQERPISRAYFSDNHLQYRSAVCLNLSGALPNCSEGREQGRIAS
jgi:hypothetical protein